MRITAIAARTVRWPIAATGAARGRSERAAVLVEVRSDRGTIGLGEAAPLPGMSRDTLDDTEAAIAEFIRRAPFELAPRSVAGSGDVSRGTLDETEAAVDAAGTSRDTLDRAEAAIANLARRAPFDVESRSVADASDASRESLEEAPRAIAGSAPLERARLAVPADAGSRGIVGIDAVRAASYVDASFLFGVAAASPAARFAIETALCDVLAREAGVSLSRWLLAHTELHIAGPVTAPALAAVVDDADTARGAYAAGIRCLKIKLAAHDPPSRVLSIAAAAPGARLRIDANRSWPPAEVAARLAALAALPIDYVEEPCRDAHRLLATPLPCRIALDESLGELSADELAEALASPQLAAVILKPTLLGGFSACLAFAARARAAGVAAIVSHGLEGPIGTAACAELALALGGDATPPGVPAGLAPHAALAGWGIQVAQLAADHVRPTRAPGLGFAGLDLAGAVAACPALDRAVADTPRQG